MFERWRTTKRSRVISEKRFEAIARIEARKIRRIEALSVVGYFVSATVRTVTGSSTWRFTLDFDQDGDVSGEYLVWSENDESAIPREMAKGMSNAIRAYLDETDGQPDSFTSGTPLNIAIEIEMLRQEGIAIRKAAEAEARHLRDAASEEAESVLSEACSQAEHTLSEAHVKAEAILSDARHEAAGIRSRAEDEAREIRADAEHVAEERREMRAKRRAFVSSHRRLLASLCIGLVLLLSLAVAFVRQGVRARYEAKLIPAGIDSGDCVGVQFREIEGRLATSGFTNISCVAVADLDAESLGQEEATRFVTIDGNANFGPEDLFPYDAEVEVFYLTAQQLHAPLSTRDAEGMDVKAVERAFADAGFANVRTEAMGDLVVGIREKPDTVASITVNGEEGFSRSDVLRPDDEVVIRYHTFRWAG